MALFSKKENTDKEADSVKTEAVVAEAKAEDTLLTEATATTVKLDPKASRSLVVPRISEKAGKMNELNKYVFTIFGKSNKIEVRKGIEAQYGVKIDRVNMITMAGRTRRFGRRTGTTQAYKKAIVTLTPGSKKIDLVEPS